MISELQQHQVEFVIIGAYAMSVFGYTRATGDIDFFVKPEKENVDKLWKALESFGAPLINISKQDFLQEGTVFQIGIAPVRIDILTKIDGISFDDINIEYHHLDGFNLPFIDLPSLIKNKKATGRLRDLADCEELEKRL